MEAVRFIGIIRVCLRSLEELFKDNKMAVNYLVIIEEALNGLSDCVKAGALSAKS